MKNSLAHLPKRKADEIEIIALKIRSLCDDVAESLRRSRRRLRQSQPRNTLHEIRNTHHGPQEHHLDILGDLAADYGPELKGILPREGKSKKNLFELLGYAFAPLCQSVNITIYREISD
ncbi:MAG: hypothetical protein ACYTEL_03770 [Planctomycetota bacterium]|jgi:hypothetical protein